MLSIDIASAADGRSATARPSLLTEATCWRIAQATRAEVLIDVQDYFLSARAALAEARSTIHLLNWAFDPDTPLDPQYGGGEPEEQRIGPFLKSLARERPELDIRILCWKSAVAISATQRFFPHRAKACFKNSGVRFLLDATVPLGACHHQKIMVIDDKVAFCGGADIGPDRWDTPAHLDHDPRREVSLRSHRDFPSRHEMVWRVEGPIAADLGDLFRQRWLRATKATAPRNLMAADAAPRGAEPAQPDAPADFTGVRAGVSLTQPAWKGAPEIRQCEALYLASVAAAERCIYLENQYITAPVVAEALAARLAEPDGPEVIIVSTAHSPSWFDQMTMDRTRAVFLKRLREADAYGRLHAYIPRTAEGRLVIVHAKAAIIDDRLLRIGSANLNNRSGGFDTECDLSIEADDDASRAGVADVRDRLVAHWLGCTPKALTKAAEDEGSLGGGIEKLRASGLHRLAPLEPPPNGPLATIIASLHLGDPCSTKDSWKPWRRKAASGAQKG